MLEEENKVDKLGSQNEGHQKFSEGMTIKRKNKKKRKLCGSLKAVDSQEVNGLSPLVGRNSKSDGKRIGNQKRKIKKKLLEEDAATEEGSKGFGVEKVKKGKKKRQKQILQESADDIHENDDNREGSQAEVNPLADNGKHDEEKQSLNKTAEHEGEAINELNQVEDKNTKSNEKIANKLKKKKAQLLKEAAKAEKRGVCYLSRIPPHMDHVKLRHILSQYGEIQRIYLAPADPTVQVHRKRAGGFQGREFSEGWVEFANKSVAKRVANMLNGEQIGGRKRSQFYYDLWNIKYLSKFKWDDLTEEIAYKSAIREQKLALEISAAKRERDFYLNKVDQSCALSSIEERLKKKQKLQKESGGAATALEQAPKVIRQFPQKKPVVDKAEENKSQLSKDILAGVFGGSER